MSLAELVTGSLGARNMTSPVPLPMAERGECCAMICFLSPLPTLPRAAKQRRKGDRLVISCQEQTYWLVNKPPVSPHVARVEEFPWVSKGDCVLY